VEGKRDPWEPREEEAVWKTGTLSAGQVMKDKLQVRTQQQGQRN
jgi:hypothetical protein